MVLGISLDYYDKILAAISMSLGGGVLVGVVTTASLREGLLAGALFATIFVYDAVFRKPPTPAQTQRAKAAALTRHVFLVVLLASLYL